MKRVKISVIKPPSNYRKIYPALGLGYIISVLKKEGFDVEFVDATIIDFPYEMLGGIPRFYWKKACIIDWKKIRSYFLDRARGVDIALISGSFTADIYNTARIADILKQRDKFCITVVGGTHVSALPQQTLEEFPGIDIVVMGEGEYIAKELVRAISTGKSYQGIKGIAYRDKTGKVIVEERAQPIANLDEIPVPSRDSMPMDKYRLIWNKVQLGAGPGLMSDPAGVIFSSRGCTGRCLFCASREISNGCMRLRSTENIVNEIEGLIGNYGISGLDFFDDFFTVDSERTLKICRALKKMKLRWSCYGRVDTISEGLLSEMKKSGCKLINYGLESGDQAILDRIGKGFTLKQVKEALAITRKAGIKYVGSFTIGMPGESKQTVKKTLRLAKTFGGIDASLFKIIPYPGSPLYRMCIKNNWLISKRWDMYDAVTGSESVYVPPGWSEQAFEKTFTSACAQIHRYFFIGRLIRSRSIFKRIPSLIGSFLIKHRKW